MLLLEAFSQLTGADSFQGSVTVRGGRGSRSHVCPAAPCFIHRQITVRCSFSFPVFSPLLQGWHCCCLCHLLTPLCVPKGCLTGFLAHGLMLLWRWQGPCCDLWQVPQCLTCPLLPFPTALPSPWSPLTLASVM